jgi:hypothetical protein
MIEVLELIVVGLMVFIALVRIETIFRLRHIEGKLCGFSSNPCLDSKAAAF